MAIAALPADSAAMAYEAAAAEWEPPPDDVFEKLGFTPNPGPQTRFLELPDENLDVLFGGASGGSKSTSLLMYGLRSCVRYPGLQPFWFRRSFPELEQSVLRMLSRYRHAQALGGRWNGSTHELRFGNGSVFTFGHAKNRDEANALLSAEINLLLLDERTTMPAEVVDMLYTRVRSGVAGVPCLGIRSATNPGGIGHTRVKKDYIDATKHGEIEFMDKSNRRRIFIQSRTMDTPQLGEEYMATLRGLPEKLRKAYLEGDWTSFEGQVFTEFAWDRHVVRPVTIPDSWRRYAGVDWGFTAPWAVVWAAEDEDKRLWVYRERYATHVNESDQAARILEAEAGEHVTARWADDAMWATRGEAKPIAQVYADNNCHITPAGKGPGSRIAGWQRIHSYLADGPACPHHRALGWDECPRMHFFTTCTETIRELADLPYNTVGDPEDADTKADDHTSDALRYITLNLGGGPEFTILSDEEPNPVAEAITPLEPMGAYAYRPMADEPRWPADDEAAARRVVRTAE